MCENDLKAFESNLITHIHTDIHTPSKYILYMPLRSRVVNSYGPSLPASVSVGLASVPELTSEDVMTMRS